jgi:hypothetical protein
MTMELPEHLRSGPLAEAAQKALADAANMASSSNSVPRISLKGREFRLIESGEEVARFQGELNVIILGVEPEAGRMAKAWYQNGYVSGSSDPPDCMSDDGIAPPSWVKNRQSDQCATCRQNTFQPSKIQGRKATKPCRDSKRAWLKIADGNMIKEGQAMKPFVQPPFSERTMYGLNVTVASLKSFSDHGRVLAGLGVAPAVAVTKLKMLDGEYPQLEFEVAAWLDAEVAPQSLKIANERPWKMFKAAGLALAGGDGGPSRTALPSMLPGQPPAHAQGTAKAADDVVDATPSQAKAVPQQVAEGDIDDAVANF